MKKLSLPWKASQYKNMYMLGSLSDDYPIQRGGKQWSSSQKSLLVHSLIENYPIPNVLLLKIKDDEKTYILDGKQRITTVVDFLSGEKMEDGSYPANAFKLDDETPIARIDVGGQEQLFEIAGLYYDELPQQVKDDVRTAIIGGSRLEDATDEEIEELFYRWNNGTALSEQQKVRVLMGTKNAIVFDTLVKHPFMQERASFTPMQKRRGENEGVILQAMMLLSGYDFKSFVVNEMTKYAKSIRGEDISEIVDILTEAFDYLYKNTSTKSMLYKKLHLPTLIMIGVNAMGGKYSDRLMDDWIVDFTMAITDKSKENATMQTNYREYMGAGSVRKSKVDGRLQEMETHFAEFAKEYEFGDLEDESKEVAVSSESDENDTQEASDVSNDVVLENEESSNTEHSEPISENNEDNDAEDSKEENSEENADASYDSEVNELEKDDAYSQVEEYKEGSIQLNESK